MKIAIFVPNRPHFGNILTQIPFFWGLKEQYPDAHITIWSKISNHQLIVKTGLADELVVYKAYSFYQLVSHLRREKYHSIFNLYSGSEKGHLAVALSGAMNRYGFGNKRWLESCYDNYLLQHKTGQYIALNHLTLLNTVEDTDYTPKIIRKLSEADKCSFHKQNNLTIVPGGGAGDYKRWDINKYCSVTKELLLRNPMIDNVIYVLGPSEKPFIETIKKEVTETKLRILESPSLETLIRLAKNSSLVIGNDCGPMHVFQMVESPLIMLWGWKEGRHSPFGTMREWYYSRDNSWCITPCENKKHINAIPAKKVITLASAILNESDHE